MDQVEQISQLLHQVPRPPEDSIPLGVTDGDIAHFEERTGIVVPAMLRTWLSITNGPCVGPGGFYGIHPRRSHLNIEDVLNCYPVWSQKKWIPVSGDGCGNHYIIPTQNEFGRGYPVLFVDVLRSGECPCFVVASDLEHFIVGTLKKELDDTGWPFRQHETLTFDPRLSQVHGVKRPWEVIIP